MTASHPSPRRKLALMLAALAAVALLCRLFPLFHVVSLRKAAEQQQAGVFKADVFAREFWATKLLPATERAVDLKNLLAALAKDPAAARKKYGHTLGIGGATLFLVRGSGKVTAVEEDAVTVALDESDAKVGLNTGLLFGNAVRDATGLLDVSAYPNSQDFNDISTQLNSIVENKVAPALKEKAAVGEAVRFAGCFELEEDAQPDAPQIVPIKVEWP